MARLLGLLATVLLLAGCGKSELRIDPGYIRLSAVAGQPAVAYFTIHGGATDATLINVSSERAIRTEMHQSMSGPGGMSSMRPLASVAVPANTAVKFEPGGRHAMLFGLGAAVAPGDRIQLLLTFGDGSRFETFPPVIAAGAPAPAI